MAKCSECKKDPCECKPEKAGYGFRKSGSRREEEIVRQIQKDKEKKGK